MEEALKISNQMVLLKDGELVQMSHPIDLLRQPKNEL